MKRDNKKTPEVLAPKSTLEAPLVPLVQPSSESAVLNLNLSITDVPKKEDIKRYIETPVIEPYGSESSLSGNKGNLEISQRKGKTGGLFFKGFSEGLTNNVVDHSDISKDVDASLKDVAIEFQRSHRKAIIQEVTKRLEELETLQVNEETALEYYILSDFELFLKSRNKQRIFIYLDTLDEYLNESFKKTFNVAPNTKDNPTSVKAHMLRHYESKKLPLLEGYFKKMLQEVNREKRKLEDTVLNRKDLDKLTNNQNIHSLILTVQEKQDVILNNLSVVQMNLTILLQLIEYKCSNQAKEQKGM